MFVAARLGVICYQRPHAASTVGGQTGSAVIKRAATANQPTTSTFRQRPVIKTNRKDDVDDLWDQRLGRQSVAHRSTKCEATERDDDDDYDDYDDVGARSCRSLSVVDRCQSPCCRHASIMHVRMIGSSCRSNAAVNEQNLSSIRHRLYIRAGRMQQQKTYRYDGQKLRTKGMFGRRSFKNNPSVLTTEIFAYSGGSQLLRITEKLYLKQRDAKGDQGPRCLHFRLGLALAQSRYTVKICVM